MANQLYLLDGHAIIYKYFHGFIDNPLITSKGLNTSATWGMAKIVTTILKNYPVTHIAVIFDPPYKNWRKQYYSEYKANREHKDDVSPQLDMAYHMLKTWGIFTAAYKPLEADDVIGILAKKGYEAGYDVVIVSKDKDMAQMVKDGQNGSIRLLDLGKTVGKDTATFIDSEGVKEKFGVYPDKIPEFLAIQGDKSDNVPGVPGIGPKIAAKYLSEYGSIGNIYQNLDKLTKSKKSNFESARETIKRDLKLVTLALKYQIPVTLDQLKKPATVNGALLDLLEEEYEFYSIIKELAAPDTI